LRLFITITICLFILPIAYAQDLFDRAEIEFDIDYIDIDNVQILGGTRSGFVMVAWMKSGSVLTKTLSKSNVEYEFSEDREFDNGGDYSPHHSIRAYDEESVFTYDKDKISIEDLRKESEEELVSRAYHLINCEWDDHITYRLFDVIFALKLNGYRGSEMVQLSMDVIKANLEYTNEPRRLLSERDMMLQFAEDDEQLTKMANDFLEENSNESS